MKIKIGLRGAAILQLASKYANVAMQLVVTAVLARLLSPSDFGILAIVSVFTALFQLFSDMGIGTAIIQYQDLTEEDHGALFSFSLILAVCLALLFCGASLPIAWFYNDARLIALCCASSPALLFSTLNMVPNGLMLKEKRFGAIALRLIVSTAISGLIAIALAWSGAGCYSLVAQSVVSSLAVFIWNFLTCKISKLNWHFISTLKHVFSYSAYQFAFSLINYFSRNLDSLIIGKALGSGSLGYYDKAYKLTTYPMNNLSSVIASVIQPYMAKEQDNKKAMAACWFKLEKILSLIGAYIAAVFVAAAPEVVLCFYGSQWAAAESVFRILSVSVYFQMLGNPSGAFFQSLGRTDLMFKSGLVNTGLSIAGLLGGLMGGSLETVSIGVSMAFCLQIIPSTYFLLVRGMEADTRILLRFAPECIAAIAAVFVCFMLPTSSHESEITQLIIKITIITIIMMFFYKASGQINLAKHLLLKK